MFVAFKMRFPVIVQMVLFRVVLRLSVLVAATSYRRIERSFIALGRKFGRLTAPAAVSRTATECKYR